MINILILFFSLIIQFGAVGIPYELVPDDNTLLLIQEIRNACLNSEDSGCLFFGDTVGEYGASNMPYYIELGSNGANNYRVCFPTSYQNTSLTSSCVSTWYLLSNGAIFCNIRWVNYTVFWYNSDTDTLTSSQNRESSTAEVVVPFRDGEARTSLIALNGDIKDENGNIIIYYEDFVENTDDNDNIGNFVNIGSLNSSGHSSGGSPIEDLQEFSWTGHSSSYIQSGHNSHVNPSAVTPDFTNATQNLLGQIIDNTNSIIQNSNSLGGALETINGNIINGASAIFNAISQTNNNFVSAYVYDSEKVNATLENSSMMLFASTTTDLTQTIINESDVLLDAVHDMDEKQDLIIYLDLTKWKVPIYSSSTGINTSYVRPYNEIVEIDFTFLKETKSIWQPLLLGVLYLALFMSIYFDLPNILRGVNG